MGVNPKDVRDARRVVYALWAIAAAFVLLLLVGCQ